MAACLFHALPFYDGGISNPYLSLGAELSEDYDQRTIVMAIRAVCGLGGALISAALSFVLFFRNWSGRSRTRS